MDDAHQHPLKLLMTFVVGYKHRMIGIRSSGRVRTEFDENGGWRTRVPSASGNNQRRKKTCGILLAKIQQSILI